MKLDLRGMHDTEARGQYVIEAPKVRKPKSRSKALLKWVLLSLESLPRRVLGSSRGALAVALGAASCAHK